jgi:hypothetical protein
MSRRPLTQTELERLAKNFGESDSDEVPENPLFIEEDDDISDVASEHSDHLSESEIEADSSDKNEMQNTKTQK